MSAAAMTIFVCRVPVCRRTIQWAGLGATVGVAVRLEFVEGAAPATRSSQLLARSVVAATGACRRHIPAISGIELCGAYETVSFDAQAFEGQRVPLIDKGPSAFELADKILPSASLVHLASPDSVKLAWQTRHPGHLRAVYASPLDTHQLKLLNGARDCNILGVRREEDDFVVTVAYLHADGEAEALVYDRVVRATGFEFDDSVFDESVRPERDETGR